MKMYTIDGTEVLVVKKIEDGYLAKQIYYGGWEEDEEAESILDQIVFYEVLFEKAPTEKLAEEVKALKGQSELLTSQINELRTTKSNEEYLLNKVNKFPIIKILADYLTEDFKFSVNTRDLEVLEKNRTYLSQYIKAVNTTSGWSLAKLRNDSYESSDDYNFMVFNTMEEVIDFSRKTLIKRLEANKRNEYTSSASLKSEHEKISYSNPVKKDESYLSKYKETFDYLVDRENKKKAEKLKLEIEELTKKQNQLEQLQSVQQPCE